MGVAWKESTPEGLSPPQYSESVGASEPSKSEHIGYLAPVEVALLTHDLTVPCHRELNLSMQGHGWVVQTSGTASQGREREREI